MDLVVAQSLGFLTLWKIVSGGCKEAKKGWRGCRIVDGQRRLTLNNVDIQCDECRHFV